MSPSPHRISLARGWTRTAGRWERIFHSPTLPPTVSQVRLVIDPSPQGSRIRLNGHELAWSAEDSRLDCDISDCMEQVNRLVVEIRAVSEIREVGRENPSPLSNEGSRTNSPFEVYLEIFEDE